MSENQSEAKNDSISVQLVREPGCLAKLEITVTPEAAKKHYEDALKKINKEVSFPGFRKGRAPKDMIIKNYGDALTKEWRQLVTEMALQESFVLCELNPLGQSSLRSLKMESCSQDEGAFIKAEVECMPSIPEIEFEGLKLTKVDPKEVTDEIINEAIEDLKGIYTDFEEVADRAAEEGDAVTVTIDQTNEPQRQLCCDARFELQEGKMAEWMRQLLIGKSAGDEVEGESKWEEHSGVEEDKFTPTQVKISISKVEKVVPPEDEETLAQRMQLANAEELRSRIGDDLKMRFENEAKAALKEQLHKQLLEKYPFDLPTSLVETERQTRIRNKIKGLKRQNASRDVILGLEKEIETMVADEVDQSLRIFFLARKVAQQADIEITRDEIIQLFNYQMMMLPPEQRIVEESMKPEEMHDRLMAQLVTEKATDYLMQRAEVA